jgi:hypothetical protein
VTDKQPTADTAGAQEPTALDIALTEPGVGSTRDGATADVQLDTIESLQPLETRDVEERRDRVRAVLAVGLLLLLCVIVALGFLVVWFPPADLAGADPDLKSRSLFVQTLLTPVASLFGAATGFYFGASKSND